MTYIENIYICIAAPLILAILFLKRDWKKALIFLLAGMTSCLISAYVSTFFAGMFEADIATASHQIAPVVEELLKFLPVLLFILLFEPDRSSTVNGILLVAVGFATFENVCYLTANGTSELVRLVIRDFGTGAMHVVCGMMVAVGMFLLWDHLWLRAMGTFAILCSAITFHAIFNVVISHSGLSLWVGSVIPLTILLISLHFVGRMKELK